MQTQHKQEEVQSLASQARDGIDGTKELCKAKEAEVKDIDWEINVAEKALQEAQREGDELTQRHAQLDISIKDFQANERNSETEKVRANDMQ